MVFQEVPGKLLAVSTLVVILLSIGVLSIGQETDQDSSAVGADPSREVAIELSGQELFAAIVTQAAYEADRLVQQEMNRYVTIRGLAFTVVLGLMGFFGYRSLTDMRSQVLSELGGRLATDPQIRGQIETSSARAVDEQVGDQLVNLRREIAFYRFANLGDRMLTHKQFSPLERDSAVELLGIIRESDSLVERAEFGSALEHIVDAFAGAFLTDEVDRIDDTMGEIAEQHSGIVYTLAQYYGMMTLGNPKSSPDIIARFEKYVDASRAHNIWEVAFPFVLALEHSRGRPRLGNLPMNMSGMLVI